MSQIMLYVFPLLLGRTLDLNTMKVGVDIYPSVQIQKPSIIECPVTETSYKIVDSTREARDLLDVSGSFSLNVKGGLVKAGASGAYMTDDYNRENTVEIIIKATYQTITESLNSKAEPMESWKSMTGLGTHYVRSVIYGGELIASVRLVCNNTRNKQNIKAALEAGGRIEIFDVGAELEGEYFSDISKSVDSTQIRIYSSVPLSTIPHNITELKALLSTFSGEVMKHNQGKGVPLKVELWPLTFLDSTRPQLLKNRMLELRLDSFEQKMDDLLNTRAAVREWMKVMVKELTEEKEKMVGKFYGEVSKTLSSFYEVIGKLDMSKDSDQLTPALQAYGKALPGSFYQRYQNLRQTVVDDQGEWTRERGSGATYIHWGRRNCTAKAETLYSGYAAGPLGHGGGSNFLCLAKRNEMDPGINEQDVLGLKGVAYKLPNHVTSLLLCATCRLPTTGSAVSFVDQDNCPVDWRLIYKGLLLSGTGEIARTDFVCVENDAQTELTNESNVRRLVPSYTFSKDGYKATSCVVCSK